MTITDITTVMGPQGVIPNSNGNTNNAPRYDTGKTDKLRYRDAVSKWTTMIRKLSKVDNKFKGILDTVGILIYMNCDQPAQDLLTRAEKNGSLNLEGDDEDEDRKILVNKILDIIAEDTSHDRVSREVKLMEDLISCERKPEEELHDFIIRFNTAVSMYTNHIGRCSPQMTRQCVSLLFKNAKLSNDSFNAAILQWSQYRESAQPASVDKICSVRPSDLQQLKDIALKAETLITENDGTPDIVNVIASLKSKIESVIANGTIELEKPETFTISKAVNVLSKMKVDAVKNSLLGGIQKRTEKGDFISQLKRKTLCIICHKPDHWWKDKPECRERMRQMHRAGLDPGTEHKQVDKNNREDKIEDDRKGRYQSPPRCTIRSRSPTPMPSHRKRDHVNNQGILKRTTYMTSVIPEGDQDLQENGVSKSSLLSNFRRDRRTTARNPIIDGGAPYNTAGLDDICKFCDALSIEVNIEKPRMNYKHGWGNNCSDAKSVIGTWYLKIQYVNGNPTTIPFDVIPGSSPMLVGLEIEKYSDSITSSTPHTITFQRPSEDSKPRKFYTYHDKDETGCERKWIDIIPHEKSTVNTLLTTTKKNEDLMFGKKIHRFSHCSIKDMKILLQDCNKWNPHMERVCKRVISRCQACAGSGRRADRSHISLRHVNDAFNYEVQADFVVVNIRNQKYYAINVICCATSFGIRMIVTNRSADTMRQILERYWIYYFGAPKRFSADPEFTRGIMHRFLELHYIKLCQRPARSSNKNGRVERQNGVFKMIIERLENHYKEAKPEDLVARASFLTNTCHGSKVLSSFQLAMGYSPSILGIPRVQVPEKPFQAHISLTAYRALQRMMKNRESKLLDQTILTPGTRVYMFHKSSRHDEPVKWEEATVEKAEEHLVRCKRDCTGRVSLVAYEDIRLKPDDDLAKELLYTSLQDEVTDERRHAPMTTEDNNDSTALMDENANELPALSETDTSDEEDNRNDREIPIHISAGTNTNQPCRKINKRSYRTGMSSFIGTPNIHDNTGLGSGVNNSNAHEEHSEINELASYFSNRLKTDDKPFLQKTVRFHESVNPNGIDMNPDVNPRKQKKRRTDNWHSSILSSDKKYPENIDIAETHNGRRKDVGKPDELVLSPSGSHLLSSRQYEIDTIYENIRNSQVTRSKLQYAPDWLLDEALRIEYEENWCKNIEHVEDTDVPRNSNIISSHVLYKVKVDEDDNKKMKARICPHGNRDLEKNNIRNDSTNAQFDMIRLLLFLSLMFSFRLGGLDVKGAYMKSGDITRLLYVRPPKELTNIYESMRGKLWRLLRLPYGISEAGRQWALVIEFWLISDMGFQRVRGASQLYIKRDRSGEIILILAKVTDDILMAGTIVAMKWLSRQMDKRFGLSKSTIDGAIDYNGCRITQDVDGSITMDMTSYMQNIDGISISRSRRKQYADTATDHEKSE